MTRVHAHGVFWFQIWNFRNSKTMKVPQNHNPCCNIQFSALFPVSRTPRTKNRYSIVATVIHVVFVLNNATTSIWRERNYVHGYLLADIISSEKRTVSWERTSRKSVSVKEQIMSKEKYQWIFSRQMGVIVFIILKYFYINSLCLGDLLSKLLNVKIIL